METLPMLTAAGARPNKIVVYFSGISRRGRAASQTHPPLVRERGIICLPLNRELAYDVLHS